MLRLPYRPIETRSASSPPPLVLSSRLYQAMTQRRLDESSPKESSDARLADGLRKSGTDVTDDLLVDITEALGDSLVAHLKQAKAGFQRCGKQANQETS